MKETAFVMHARAHCAARCLYSETGPATEQSTPAVGHLATSRGDGSGGARANASADRGGAVPRSQQVPAISAVPESFRGRSRRGGEVSPPPPLPVLVVLSAERGRVVFGLQSPPALLCSVARLRLLALASLVVLSFRKGKLIIGACSRAVGQSRSLARSLARSIVAHAWAWHHYGAPSLHKDSRRSRLVGVCWCMTPTVP